MYSQLHGNHNDSHNDINGRKPSTCSAISIFFSPITSPVKQWFNHNLGPYMYESPEDCLLLLPRKREKLIGGQILDIAPNIGKLFGLSFAIYWLFWCQGEIEKCDAENNTLLGMDALIMFAVFIQQLHMRFQRIDNRTIPLVTLSESSKNLNLGNFETIKKQLRLLKKPNCKYRCLSIVQKLPNFALYSIMGVCFALAKAILKQCVSEKNHCTLPKISQADYYFIPKTILIALLSVLFSSREDMVSKINNKAIKIIEYNIEAYENGGVNLENNSSRRMNNR
jgi:hypothetical protein